MKVWLYAGDSLYPQLLNIGTKKIKENNIRLLNSHYMYARPVNIKIMVKNQDLGLIAIIEN